MRVTVPGLIACTVMLAGVATAQDGYYASKADEKAGRLTPGRVAAPTRAGSPDVGGENCANPAGISALPYVDSDDTSGHADDNNSIPPGCSDYTSTAGPDLVYVFSTGPGNNIAFNVNPIGTTFDVAIYILGTCGNSATCVIGADACLANGQPHPIGCVDLDGDEDIPAVLDRFASGTHAIYVDSFYAAGAICPGQGNMLCGNGPYALSVTGVLPAELVEIRIE